MKCYLKNYIKQLLETFLKGEGYVRFKDNNRRGD